MQRLQEAVRGGYVLWNLPARDLESVFAAALDLAVKQGGLTADCKSQVLQRLLEREAQISTAIGHSVAIPHAYLDVIAEPLIVFVRLEQPINLGAPDGIPTRFLYVLLGPTGAAADHLDTLTIIARLMADDEFRYELGLASSEQQLIDAFERYSRPDAERVPLKPQADESLQYTGRFAGGLLGDVRRRFPYYMQDFRDGLHPKCIGVTLFLFFACLAPAVTFGGLMFDLTGGHIGAVKMIAASALGGVIYALVSGQPLTILGGTGPLLAFTGILYLLCGRLGIGEHFMAVYALVGLWTMVFLLILAVTDASCLMRYFTRFTDEIFAALISLIFIVEALRRLFEIFVEVYSKGGTISHDQALIPLILAMGTYLIATNLSRFRKSRYLLPWMREFLADFGPMIAIAIMTLGWIGLRSLQEVELTSLPAPDVFKPSVVLTWLINPFTAPQWVWYASAVPALLATVLIFLTQNITTRLLNDPAYHLDRGATYHLDLAVIAGLTGLCAILGLPLLTAALVRSINHIRGVATMEEVVNKRGETTEHIIHTRDNRLTALAIHLLLGGSLLLLPLMKQIPMSVLYGLFLFMGVVSMAGNRFFERISMWLMEPALYPQTHYIRRVPLTRMHLYTLIQMVCLIVLWIVQASVLGILFPLFVALLVPVRLLLDRFFAPEHLAVLDADEEPGDDEEDHWF